MFVVVGRFLITYLQSADLEIVCHEEPQDVIKEEHNEEVEEKVITSRQPNATFSGHPHR